MGDGAAAIVAGAVESYRASHGEEPAFFAEELPRVLGLDRTAAADLVTPYLTSGDPLERAAAGQLLGRLGEASRGSLARVCSELLFARLLAEADAVARDGIEGGLGLIWAATGDEATPLELARHPNVNARHAAAHSLALTTTDRAEDAEPRAALEELASDPDAGVRAWAATGLDAPHRLVRTGVRSGGPCLFGPCPGTVPRHGRKGHGPGACSAASARGGFVAEIAGELLAEVLHGRAPTTVTSASPPANRITVGIESTP